MWLRSMSVFILVGCVATGVTGREVEGVVAALTGLIRIRFCLPFPFFEVVELSSQSPADPSS